jgi:hypothetical protein
LGYIFAYSSLGGVIWVLSIAWSLKQMLIEKHHNIEFYHNRWFACAMILPAAITGLPFITSSYGFCMGWCTIKEEGIGMIWKLLVFYIPAWIIVIAIFFLYIRTARNLRKDDILDYDNTKDKFIRRIFAYPAIMVISFLPITCVRILTFIGFKIELWFLATAYFIYGVYGLMNSIAYGYNETVIRGIKESLLKENINNSSVPSDSQDSNSLIY